MENIVALEQSITDTNKIASLFGLKLEVAAGKLRAYDIETNKLLTDASGKEVEIPLNTLFDSTVILHSINKFYFIEDVTYYGEEGLVVGTVGRVLPTDYVDVCVTDCCNVPRSILEDDFSTKTFRFQHYATKKEKNNKYEKISYEEFVASEFALMFWSKNNDGKAFRFRYAKNEETFKDVNDNIVSVDVVNKCMKEVSNSELINSLVEEVCPNIYQVFSNIEGKKI